MSFFLDVDNQTKGRQGEAKGGGGRGGGPRLDPPVWSSAT